MPLPSLSDQQVIVEKLDKAFAEIELFKSQLAMEKQKAAALRQSILNNAFDFADEAA
jgi:restriction endonuclease S subunit